MPQNLMEEQKDRRLCAWTLQNNFKKIIFWIMSSLVMKQGVVSTIPRPNASPLSGDRRIPPGQRSDRCQSPRSAFSTSGV
jgi:hypothetical protein